MVRILGLALLLLGMAVARSSAETNGEALGAPAVDPGESESSSQTTPQPSLEKIFSDALGKDKVAGLGESPTAEKLAARLESPQRVEARSRLSALEQISRTPEQRAMIFRGYMLLGDPESARALAARMLEESPKDPAALGMSAQARLEQGDRAGALSDARRTLELNPSDEQARRIILLGSEKGIGRNFKIPKSPFGNAVVENGHIYLGVAAGRAAKAAVASSPLPEAGQAPYSSSWPKALQTAGCMAFGATGSLLLFGGLLAPPLEKRWPDVRRDMGIAGAGAAVIGSGLLLAGLSLKRAPQVVAAGSSIVAQSQEADETAASGVERLGEVVAKIPPGPAQAAVAEEPLVREMTQEFSVLRSIGKPGTSNSIRLVDGTIKDAETLFEKLARFGKPVTSANYPGKLVELPNGARIGLRPVSSSGPPTIDIHEFAGVAKKLEIKFVTSQ